MRKHRNALWAIFFFAALLMCGSGLAAFIQDDPDLLSDEEEIRLMELMQPLSAYGTPMVWVVDDSVENAESEHQSFFRQHVGQADGGVLVILDESRKSNRQKFTVYSEGPLHQYLTNEEIKKKVNVLMEEASSMVKRGGYFTGARTFFWKIPDLIKEIQIRNSSRPINSIMLAGLLALAALMLYITGVHMKDFQKGRDESMLLPVTADRGFVFQTSDERCDIVSRREKDITLETD